MQRAAPPLAEWGRRRRVWKECSADRPESIQSLATTHSHGEVYKEKEDGDGQDAASDRRVRHLLSSFPWTNICDFSVCVVARVPSFLLSPSWASAKFQRQHWTMDTEDDVIRLPQAGTVAEIMGWAADCGSSLPHFSLQVCWLVRVDRWGLGSGCYWWYCCSQRRVGHESPRNGWCHRQGFVNTLDKGTKSQGWA